MPPPPSLLRETKISDEVAKPSAPQPSISLDKVIPKVEIPKVEIPKVEIPKVEIPKVEIPKPPRPPQTKPDMPQESISKPAEPTKTQKKKAEDNFVFSEVSLKSFVKDVIAEDKENLDESELDAAKIKDAQEKKIKEEAERRQKQKEENARKKKQVAEQKKLAAEAREKQKQEEEEKRKQMIESKRAQAVVDAAKPRSTISLGFFNFLGSNSDDSSSSTSTSTSKAPSGIPTLSKWKQNADGSVTGLISGSKAFRNNESVTTSPIKTKSLSPDSVVVTVSGSK